MRKIKAMSDGDPTQSHSTVEATRSTPVPDEKDNPFTNVGANAFALAGRGFFVRRFTQGGADFVQLALGYHLSVLRLLDIGFRIVGALI